VNNVIEIVLQRRRNQLIKGAARADHDTEIEESSGTGRR